MKKHCPFFASILLVGSVSSLLLLSGCQADVSTAKTAKPTQSQSNVTSETPSSSTVESSSTETAVTAPTTVKGAPSPTPTKAPQNLKIEITLEKITENFVVWDGAELVDEYSGSYMYRPVVKTGDPAVTAEIEAVVNEKMTQINNFWSRFIAEKATALAGQSRVSVVLRADMQVDQSNGFHSIFSRFLYGGYRSEYNPAEYFSINIDSKDGHIISFDELLLRMKITANEIALKANTILQAKGGVYSQALVKPGDIKEGRLFYDGKTLQLLVPIDDPNSMGLFEELVDLGPVN